jgi:hypothetical protein
MSDEQIKFFLENNQKLTWEECAQKMGLKRHQVCRYGKNLGLKPNPLTLRKSNINLDNFKDIKIPEIAYFLGLIFADGTISKGSIEFCIKEVDFNEIEHILPIIGKFSKYKYSYQGQNRQPSAKACFHDMNLVDFAKANGFKGTSFKKILNLIPNELHNYFWRGLLDGDGCFSNSGKRSGSFCYTSEWDFDWTELELLCKEKNIKYLISKRVIGYGKSSCFWISKPEDIIKFGSFVYKNYLIDKIGLPRKFNKFLEIVNTRLSFLERKKFVGINTYKGKFMVTIINKKQYLRYGPFLDIDKAALYREEIIKTSECESFFKNLYYTSLIELREITKEFLNIPIETP